MKNGRLKNKKEPGVVQFLKKYTHKSTGVTYMPGDFERFFLTDAKALQKKKIVKLLKT